MGGPTFHAEPDDVAALADGDMLDLAGLTLTVGHAPGHTLGSVAFRLPTPRTRPRLLFTGDLLFAGSIGRTDLPGGYVGDDPGQPGPGVLPLDDDDGRAARATGRTTHRSGRRARRPIRPDGLGIVTKEETS